MASRTIYSCDICGKEVRRQSELRYFSAELDHDVEKKSAGARDPINREVCSDCGSNLMSAIRSVIEQGGETSHEEGDVK